ncbi:MAG: tetratricopeptide repeat protein, partial [Bacteroidia bacterium]
AVLIFVFSDKAEATIPRYKQPRGTYALSAEWLNTKAAIEGLLAELEENPDNYKVMLQLVQAYIQEARNTGDHAYYDKAALELCERILKKEPNNFETLCCKATVELSQHHFSEALATATKAQKINADNAFIYGLLCDAYVELGNYTEAVKMADKMISIRPDIRSYSRISYLREIHGDLPGAISAMKLAVAAGYPGLEQTAWTRTVLGHLYESIGALDSAALQYQLALNERPDYPFALAGLGHIANAQGKYADAEKNYVKASQLMTEYSFSEALIDVYENSGQTAKAKTATDNTLELLGPGSGDEEDEGHGHYADKELAYVYLKAGDNAKAMEHAKLEYARRPANIEVLEMMGWVNYKSGNFAEADKYMTQAMKTNCQSPELLCRAGLAAIKNGRTGVGSSLIQKAFAGNPFIAQGLRKEAAAYAVAK